MLWCKSIDFQTTISSCVTVQDKVSQLLTAWECELWAGLNEVELEFRESSASFEAARIAAAPV